MQLYRGKTFGDYFQSYSTSSAKPLLVSEYGVDAYNDACGWDQNDGKVWCAPEFYLGEPISLIIESLEYCSSLTQFQFAQRWSGWVG